MRHGAVNDVIDPGDDLNPVLVYCIHAEHAQLLEDVVERVRRAERDGLDDGASPHGIVFLCADEINAV